MTSKGTPRYQSALPVVTAIALGVFTLTAARAFAQTEPPSGIEPVLDLAAPFAGNPALRGANPTVGLGSAGDVIGTLQLAGDGVTTANDLVLFHTAPGGVPRIVIREGDPIDPAGHPEAQWLEAEDFYVDRFGTIAILARVTDPVNGWTRALLRGTADHLQVVAMDADLGEGWGIGLSGLQLSSPGRLAFMGVTAEGSQLWFDELTTGSVQLDRNTPIAMPPGAVLAAVYSPFLLNDFDDLLFRGLAQNSAGGGTAENLDGVWVKNSLGVQALLLNNSPSPVFPDTTVSLAFNRDYLQFSDSGWAVVKVRHSGSPDGVHDGTAIYVGAPGQLHLVVDEGTEPVGLDGATFTSDFRLQGMSESGDVFFRNRIRLASGATPDSHWRWGGGVLHLVAMEGQSAPGYPEENLDGLETDGIISASGQAIVRSRVGTSFLVSALLVQSPGQPLRWLLGTGDPFPGPNETQSSVDTASLMVPKSGARFDDRGRFLARIMDVNLRESLVWVDPAALLPPSPGTITGTVLDDTDGSGGFSAADSGLAGARLELFHADASGQPAGDALAFVVTDPTGVYTFRELPAGEYVVVEINPPGYASVTDAQGANDDRLWLTLTAGQSSVGNDFLDGLSLLAGSLTLHRLEPDAVNNLEGDEHANSQLLPADDFDRLTRLPEVNRGWVADDVTPLILRVSFQPGDLAGPRDIRWRVIDVEDGGMEKPLAEYLTTLRGPCDADDRHVVSPDCPTAMAMFFRVPEGELRFRDGSSEIRATVVVEDVSSGRSLAQRSVALRRPPVLLIHDYNSKGDWGEAFRQELASEGRPFNPADANDNFVRTIRYGQREYWELGELATGISAEQLAQARGIVHRENTYLPLAALVPLLHRALDEDLAVLQRDWAITRYDVVAHGQGGLLARMLASEQGRTGSHPAFRSRDNFYRGRFRHVATFGAPHNGARLSAYLRELDRNQDFLRTVPECIVGLGIFSSAVQDKFDPFGEQIRALNDPDVNNAWKPDRFAAFHRIAGWLPSGRPTLLEHQLGLRLHYRDFFPGLNGATMRDGLVEFTSALAGDDQTTNHVSLGFGVAHFDPLCLYEHRLARELEISSATQSELLARMIRIRLLGQSKPPEGFFGWFPLPVLLGATNRNAIVNAANDALVENWSTPEATLVAEGPGALGAARHGAGLMDLDTVFRYRLDAPDLGTDSEVAWFAEAFGTDGVTVNALAVEAVVGDPLRADVTVPDSLVGDVVLYASYLAANGRTAFGQPATVFERDPPGAEISEIGVIPLGGQFPVGESIKPQLWVVYTDGTVMQRYVSADNFTVVCSDPTVVNVSEPLVWELAQPGEVTITASYRGVSTSGKLTVRSSVAAPQGLRITDWAFDESGFRVTVPVWDDAELILWRSHTLTGGSWSPVPNTVVTRPAPETAVLEDISPPDQPTFYRVEVIGP